MSPRGRIPYLPIVVAFCVAAIVGYAVLSYWAVFIARDATMTGDVIGTWKSFAVLAFGFWLGSSSGGKAKDEVPPKVQIDQPAGEPVPVEEKP
jgi:hypothetical protein